MPGLPGARPAQVFLLTGLSREKVQLGLFRARSIPAFAYHAGGQELALPLLG